MRRLKILLIATETTSAGKSTIAVAVLAPFESSSAFLPNFRGRWTTNSNTSTASLNGQFNLRPQLVADGHDLNFDELVSEMIVSVDNFNARGSGFVLDRIKNCVIVITQFRPLAGSTYIPTRSLSFGKKLSSTLRTKTSGASNVRFFQVCTHQKTILPVSTVTPNIETL